MEATLGLMSMLSFEFLYLPCFYFYCYVIRTRFEVQTFCLQSVLEVKTIKEDMPVYFPQLFTFPPYTTQHY